MKTPVLSRIPFRERGVGLVELMITLLLGALITAGTISLFTANRQTFLLQDNVSQAEESGSFALDFIARDLRRAGFPGGDPNQGVVPPFDPGMYATGLIPNDNVQTNPELVKGVSTTVTYTDDQLAVVYQASPYSSLTTCTGDAVQNTKYLANVYFVATNSTTKQRELMCQGYLLAIDANNNITGRTALSPPQALATGVDSFQVLYGVDLTFDHAASDTANNCPTHPALPNTYISGNQLAAAYTYGRTQAPKQAAGDPPLAGSYPDCFQPLYPQALVRAVRIGLLMRTNSDVDAATPKTQVYPVLDHAVMDPAFKALQDGHIRRLFLATVALRNSSRVMK